MIIDKNLNPDDYKEELMKKHNLTEAQWKEVSDFAKLLLKCDDISIMPPFIFLNNLLNIKDYTCFKNMCNFFDFLHISITKFVEIYNFLQVSTIFLNIIC